MQKRLEIALRGMPPSSALERHITEEARKLTEQCDRVRGCRVLAEVQQVEQRQGAQFAARLVITLPGTEIVVNREHRDDVFRAVCDAFAAASLQVEDHMRRHEPESRFRSGRNGMPDPRR